MVKKKETEAPKTLQEEVEMDAEKYGALQDRSAEFLTLTVSTPFGKYSQDLNSDLEIHPEDLNSDYCDQPAKFAWWATLAASAQAVVDRLKTKIEIQDTLIRKDLKGKLDSEIREQMELDGIKVTEGKVEAAFYSHAEYLEAANTLKELQQQLIDAQDQARILGVAKEAMNQRKDMLISLGAAMRMDMGNLELAVKKAEAKKVLQTKKL